MKSLNKDNVKTESGSQNDIFRLWPLGYNNRNGSEIHTFLIFMTSKNWWPKDEKAARGGADS